MISIRIEKLTKRFGAVTALHGLDLVVEPGELFFLLGPSGCGKTTLLRCMAGFYVPEEGRIFFGDEDVTRLAPHKRNTGMMFQSYALWPHMTVAENVAFGLEERKLPRAEIRTKVGEALESVHMGAYAERRPNQTIPGGSETVLLVEDEPWLRSLTKRLLERQGYTVIDARSGAAALDIWREHRDRIRLVLTDMVMPDGVSGPELVKQLQQDKPDLPAIFTSGYGAEFAGKDFALTEGVNFLQKPCPFHHLAQTLRQALDQ